MKISIITACYNSAATVVDTLKSVSGQGYVDIEHIIVDGGSTDNTLALVKEHGKRVARVISGPDSGIYDALNKGIKASTGEITGILHSDDAYQDENSLNRVAETFKGSGADSCYGDLVYVKRDDAARVVRRWRAGAYKATRFRNGWMPPHPAFFLKRSCHEKYGLYDTSFPIAADYELMLRMLYRHGISSVHIPEVLVRMRAGGTSNPGLLTTARCLKENYRAWKVNGLELPPQALLLKPLSKLLHYRL
jgi:glycosyltransferase